MKQLTKLIALTAAFVMLFASFSCAFAADSLQPEAQVTQSQADTKWFYDSTGQRVTAAQLGEAGSVVQLKKWVESTGAENNFKVTLEVTTTENLLTLPHSRDAAVMLILDNSSSMDRLMGTDENSPDRMTVLQSAANEFLRTFALNTDAQTGDRRLASIITFNQNAKLHMPWIDLHSTTVVDGKETSNLDLAKASVFAIPHSSGTNIEGGIHAAASYMNASKQPGGILENVDYLYTILISDGEPGTGSPYDDNKSFLNVDMTAANALITSFTNENNTDGMSRYDRVDTVGDGIDVIRSLSKLSEVYGVCLAAYKNRLIPNEPLPTEDQQNKLHPTFDHFITVGNWFQLFCDQYYEIASDDITGLSRAFESIAAKIRFGSAAFHLQDAMGDGIRYIGAADSVQNAITANGDSFEWDLRSSARTAQNITVGNTAKEAYKYTYSYNTRLNTLNTDAGTGVPVNNNSLTQLNYITSDAQGRWPATAIYSAKLPVPEVQGYAANLSFTKVGPDGTTPLADAEFTLTHNQTACPCGFNTNWSATCTSLADGAVTFSNIPSGHHYTLLENPPTGYASPGVFTVTTSLGTASLSGNGVSGSADGLIVKNDKDLALTGNLKITKSISGHDAPQSIRFAVEKVQTGEGMGYSTIVALNDANDWTVELKNIPSGTYTVKELLSDAAFANYDHTVTATVNGSVASVVTDTDYASVTLAVPEQGGNVTAEFANRYTQHTGTVVIRKTINHTTEYPANSFAAAYMAQYAQADRKEIEEKLSFCIKNAGGTTLFAPQYAELSPVSGANYAEYRVQIPVGDYTLFEFSGFSKPQYMSTVDQLTYTLTDGQTRYHLAQNGDTISGYCTDDGQRIYLDKDETVLIHYTNNYRIPVGTLLIHKYFDGIPESLKAPAEESTTYFEIEHLETSEIQGSVPYISSVFGLSSSKHSTGDIYRTYVQSIPVGKYYVSEVNPPDFSDLGYRLLKAEWSTNQNQYFSDQMPGTSLEVFEEKNGAIYFLNTYVPQGKLTIREQITGDLNDDEIAALLSNLTFTVTDANGNVIETLSGKNAVIKDGWYEITTDLPLDEGTYTVTETGDTVQLYDRTDTVKVTSAAGNSEDASNSTTVTLSHDDWETAAKVDFINNYASKTASVQFGGRKTLDGRGFLSTDQFTFTVTAQTEGAPMPESPSVTLRPAENSTFVFDAITYTVRDVGKTYTYRITENAGSLSGILYDDTVYNAIVTVAQANNAVTASAVLQKANGNETVAEIVFTNTYEAAGSVSLSARKTLAGKALAAEQFSFELKDADGNVIETVKNAADGSVTFSAITFDQDDAGKEFVYTISEVNDGKNGYTYDAASHTVTVTVTDNGNGTLTAAADKTGADVIFTNTYAVKSTTYVPKASKELTGEDPTQPAAFTFLLTADSANPADGAALTSHTATVTGKGDAAFDAITFSKAGIYRFTITEQNDAAAGYHYDTTPWLLTVTVEDRDSQLTVVSALYAQQKENGITSADKAVFTNAFSVTSATFTPAVTKAVTGVPATNELHVFTLRESGAHPQGSVYLPTDLTASVTGEGEAVFDTITFLTKGVYTFAITENAGSNPACEYDGSEWLLTVTVTEQDSILSAVGEYSLNGQPGAPVFTNHYQPGALVISKTVTGEKGNQHMLFGFTVTVTLDNGTLHDGEYTCQTVTDNSVVPANSILKNGGTLYLKHGQQAIVQGLPAGASYKVTELEANLNGYQTSTINAEGKIAANEQIKVQFFNHYIPAEIPQTGDPHQPLLYVLLCLMTLLAMYQLRKKRC